jgi:hypothetical protein
MTTTRTHRSNPLLAVSSALLAVLTAVALNVPASTGARAGEETRAAAPSAVVPTAGPSARLTTVPSEVLPGSGPARPLYPPVLAQAPVLSGKAPAPALGVGSLARGFPDVIPVAPLSTVATSSVTSSAGIVQATLAADSRSTCAQIREFYLARFAKIGLASTDVASAGASNALSFTRADDSTTLTLAARSDGTCRYSVFGVFTTTL